MLHLLRRSLIPCAPAGTAASAPALSAACASPAAPAAAPARGAAPARTAAGEPLLAQSILHAGHFRLWQREVAAGDEIRLKLGASGPFHVALCDGEGRLLAQETGELAAEITTRASRACTLHVLLENPGRHSLSFHLFLAVRSTTPTGAAPDAGAAQGAPALRLGARAGWRSVR